MMRLLLSNGAPITKDFEKDIIVVTALNQKLYATLSNQNSNVSNNSSKTEEPPRKKARKGSV